MLLLLFTTTIYTISIALIDDLCFHLALLEGELKVFITDRWIETATEIQLHRGDFS